MSKNTIAYYDATALEYDELHGDAENPEHVVALERSWRLMEGLSISSVLDVGCGTGRALQWMHRRVPSIKLYGVDPSQALLEIAQKSFPGATLKMGSGERLPLADGEVDLAIATGIMHHVDDPSSVIAEMFRVAQKAILISDHNNFAFGNPAARRLRMALRVCGLLKFATFVKQGFRKQGYTLEDGWWYPYSLLDDHAVIARYSDELYVIPTRPVNTDKMGNLLFAQSHLAVFAIKRS